MTDRGSLEILVAREIRRVARQLKGRMPPGVGFALLVFDFGGKGNLAYASSAERSDMLAAMREFIAKHEAGEASSVFGGPRS